MTSCRLPFTTLTRHMPKSMIALINGIRLDLRESGALERFQEQNRLLMERLTSLERDALNNRFPYALQVGHYDASRDATNASYNAFSGLSTPIYVERGEYSSNLGLEDNGWLQTNTMRSASLNSDHRSATVDAPFINLIRILASAIEINNFGEQTFRVKKRIALAHFYNTYILAQDDPCTFLSWCKDAGEPPSLIPRGTLKSLVLIKSAGLLLYPTTADANASPAYSSNESLKARQGKIKGWRKNGKQWDRLIARFDYGILLLVPGSLTDEDLRIAHDDDMSYIMQEMGKHLHEDQGNLKLANFLVRTHLLSPDLDLPLGPFMSTQMNPRTDSTKLKH
ncbi:hypothetical protein M409DRAFT_29975 [Zasmidium cellare ATCC 36951]|uniref:Uncharacterized protein n=1 Tax=Zasmidium cellare ATCC 36951 TaxID=1080233 RepID=A0A6A6C104_ZASCE|nr:uncharacterized protein M409DRAFT_29975 [Zasmidium cellare ATCC 36951]KAF2159502.1 hypothetical protein M409DRAFT_29975 [Zasmidium cellare ATCC 36951]